MTVMSSSALVPTIRNGQPATGRRHDQRFDVVEADRSARDGEEAAFVRFGAGEEGERADHGEASPGMVPIGSPPSTNTGIGAGDDDEGVVAFQAEDRERFVC